MRKIFLLLILFLLLIPITAVQARTFSDVDVTMIGNCNSVYTDVYWPKCLYIGTFGTFGISDIKAVSISIYSKGSLIYTTTLIGKNANVFMANANGIFFWFMRFSGYRKNPPFLYVDVHTEKVYINTW